MQRLEVQPALAGGYRDSAIAVPYSLDFFFKIFWLAYRYVVMSQVIPVLHTLFLHCYRISFVLSVSGWKRICMNMMKFQKRFFLRTGRERATLYRSWRSELSSVRNCMLVGEGCVLVTFLMPTSAVAQSCSSKCKRL